jgi:RimJ/RimL family protein N-acetyltransferase
MFHEAKSVRANSEAVPIRVCLLRVDITLVPYQPDFLEPFLEWRAQAASVRHNPLRKMTPEETKAILESQGTVLSDLKKYEEYRWFVEYAGKPIGSVSLKNISHSMKYAEIGYGISEAYHRRGIATHAVKLMIEKVFRETDLRKLIAYVHDKNAASCRVLEKLGFQREGFLREHFIINGSPENEILFALLKHEWSIARR